jgi:hypothetical protein
MQLPKYGERFFAPVEAELEESMTNDLEQTHQVSHF